MLYVCRNAIVFRRRRFRFGLRLLVFSVQCLRGLTTLVGVLCCFVRLFLSFAHRPMIMVVLSSVSFRIVAKFFVLLVCMLLIVIRNGKIFFDDVCEWVDPSVPTVLCGDFNAVFDRVADRVGSDPDDTARESSVALAHLFSSCCVTDIWRYLHPSTNSFTWSRRNGLFASRIDLIGCSHAWISSVSGCDILSFPFSDHCALSFSVSVPDAIPLGPGLWKLNTSILQESDYISLITGFWSLWRVRTFAFPTLAEWWDAGKAEIKRLTMDYCRNRAKVKGAERDLLSRLVTFLKEKLDSGATYCLAPYQSALSNLGKLDLEIARGAQIRSRVRWTEEGEASSAYFFRLVKKQNADRLVAALRQPDGTVVNSAPDLVECFSQFYSDLFSAEPVDPGARDALLSNVTVRLSVEECNVCEGALTAEECFTALQGMARRKTPGCDGLPMEFYHTFWSVLGSDLVRVLNSCASAGRLSRSQRRGVISLSFKKGDRLDLRNWRPISLLNVDYKIASRAIAGRLLQMLSSVIDKDQTCGVPGRFIGENVAFLRDVVDYASHSGSPCALLSLDQEKAFDRVDWGFLKASLCGMGFGPSFSGWVELSYSGSQSAVNVNGHVSSFFSLSRGVRQGCPLSPLLYVLVAEVLACNIRCHPDISGMVLPGASVPLPPLSQYADDTSVVVTSDRAIVATFEVHDLYQRGQGPN